MVQDKNGKFRRFARRGKAIGNRGMVTKGLMGTMGHHAVGVTVMTSCVAYKRTVAR